MKKYKLFFVLVVAPLFLGGCFSKVSTPQKNTDIFDSAVASRNEVICDHIKEDGLSSQCKLEVARQRDSDLFNRAVSTGDPHACDNLSSENAKSKCLAIVSPPTPSAAPVALPTGESEAFDKALAERSEALCNGISDPLFAQRCRSAVLGLKDSDLLNRAVSKGDPALCEKLSSSDSRLKCLAILSPPSPEAEPGALPTGEGEAFDKALAERSEALCNGISDPLFAQRCRSAVLGLKDSDLLNEAVEKKDPTLCERLSTPEAKAKCVEVVKNSQAEVTDQ